MEKKHIFIGIGLFILSFLFSFFLLRSKSEALINPLFSKSKKEKVLSSTTQEKKTRPNEPKTEECPINGEMLTRSERERWEKRRPLGVMVENHVEARPQSGLSSADVIYEAVAEGGITRFLAIFYCHDAPYVGPVRSARVYFITLLRGYGTRPLYAHVGGANREGPADALGMIEKIGWAGYNDLNQFSVPFPYYWRDYERLKGRVTEHTVYTSTGKLWKFAKEERGLTDIDKKGVLWSKGFERWEFEDDAPMAKRGNIDKISFGFWTKFANNYHVTWLYDLKSNTYKRMNGGKPHLDRNNYKQLQAKDVIIVFSKESPANDGYPHLLYKLIGTGKALVFKNGKVIKGRWVKESPTSRMQFYEGDKKIKLVRGKVFVEILPLGNKVEY